VKTKTRGHYKLAANFTLQTDAGAEEEEEQETEKV